jgi:hypothetical protein
MGGKKSEYGPKMFFLVYTIVLTSILAIGFENQAKADTLSDTLMSQIFPWRKFSFSNNGPELQRFVFPNNKISTCIPKEYIEAIYPDNDGSATITLEAYLPDLEPRRVYWAKHPFLSSSPYQSPEKIAFRNAITQTDISESYAGPDDPFGQKRLHQLLSGIIKSYTVAKTPTIKNFTEYDNNYGWSIYVHQGPDDYGIICTGVDCGISYIYKNTFRVDLDLDKSNLFETELIKQKFDALLDTFACIPTK